MAGGAGQVGAVLCDQAVKAVVDVVGAQSGVRSACRAELAVPLAVQPVVGVEVKALGVAACVANVAEQRVQTPPFLLG